VSVVLWITNFVALIEAVLAYMDDSFSHYDNPSLVLYLPYNMLFRLKKSGFLSCGMTLASHNIEKSRSSGGLWSLQDSWLTHMRCRSRLTLTIFMIWSQLSERSFLDTQTALKVDAGSSVTGFILSGG
jgi:hypothetical protein